MGEHVAEGVFRVVDVSVQRRGGSHGHFVRDPANHNRQLQGFFDRVGRDFTRFNYLGEWHSHPTFAPAPSTVDVATMRSLVADSSVGVNFLVLLIVRLIAPMTMEGTATVFAEGMTPMPVSVACEQQEPNTCLARVARWLRPSSDVTIEMREFEMDSFQAESTSEDDDK